MKTKKHAKTKQIVVESSKITLSDSSWSIKSFNIHKYITCISQCRVLVVKSTIGDNEHVQTHCMHDCFNPINFLIQLSVINKIWCVA